MRELDAVSTHWNDVVLAILAIEEVSKRGAGQELHRRRPLPWTDVSYVWYSSVLSRNVVPPIWARSVIIVWPKWLSMSAVAGGGVKVPSVAFDTLPGTNPALNTSDWRSDRFASMRVSELTHSVVRSSFSGRLLMSVVW